MKGFIRLEKKYGIRVVKDDIYNPLIGKVITKYKMYSADGCLWENGLTKNGVKDECKQWSKALLDIKDKTENG